VIFKSLLKWCQEEDFSQSYESYRPWSWTRLRLATKPSKKWNYQFTRRSDKMEELVPVTRG